MTSSSLIQPVLTKHFQNSRFNNRYRYRQDFMIINRYLLHFLLYNRYRYRLGFARTIGIDISIGQSLPSTICIGIGQNSTIGLSLMRSPKPSSRCLESPREGVREIMTNQLKSRLPRYAVKPNHSQFVRPIGNMSVPTSYLTISHRVPRYR